MRKLIIITFVFALLLSIVGCTKPADTIPTDAPYPTSKKSGEDAEITPDIRSEIVSTVLTEVEPKNEPTGPEDKGTAITFLDTDELFSLFGYVIYGKITGKQEIKYEKTYGSGDVSSYYATVLDIEVQKNYGDKEFEHIKDGIIRVCYDNSSYNYYKTAVELDIDMECILFLADTSNIRENFKQDFFDYAPYCIFSKNECVIEKNDKGFNAYGLMALAEGKEYSYYTEGDRVTDFHTLEEVESVILENVDKLQGLTYKKFLENYMVRRYSEDE
ncbi:MAG: hypothetical protein GX802_01945 [Clostridiales bacterium]|jgi:hypothetical protein|nr:hypothetical protein [Clostridiales bacterium]